MPEPISSPFKLLPTQGRMERRKKRAKRKKQHPSPEEASFCSFGVKRTVPRSAEFLALWTQRECSYSPLLQWGRKRLLCRQAARPWGVGNFSPESQRETRSQDRASHQGLTPPHPPPGAPQRESAREGLSPLRHGRSRKQSGQHPRTQRMLLCRWVGWGQPPPPPPECWVMQR